MIVVLLGQIASGKTMQAQRLAEHHNTARLSLGVVLRQRYADDPRLANGELLPSDMVEAAVAAFFEQIYTHPQQLIVIDGFPRTLEQKEWLDRYLSSLDLRVNRAIVIEVEPEEIDRRLAARKRKDDNASAIAARKQVFYDQVGEVVEAYDSDDVLFRLNGNGTIDEVAERIEAVL